MNDDDSNTTNVFEIQNSFSLSLSLSRPTLVTGVLSRRPSTAHVQGWEREGKKERKKEDSSSSFFFFTWSLMIPSRQLILPPRGVLVRLNVKTSSSFGRIGVLGEERCEV